MTETLNEITRKHPSSWWLAELEKVKIGCGPINDLEQVFDDPQVKAREMTVEMAHPATGGKPAKLIASPDQDVGDAGPLPPCAADAGTAYRRVCWAKCWGLSSDDVAALREKGVV